MLRRFREAHLIFSWTANQSSFSFFVRSDVLVAAVDRPLYPAARRPPPTWFPAPPTRCLESTNQATPVSRQSARTVLPAPTPSSRFVCNEIPEQSLVVTNDHGALHLHLPWRWLEGSGIAGFPETVSSRRQRRVETNEFATLNPPRPRPVFAILGTGNESLQGDGVFKLTQTEDGVHAEKSLTNGLTLVKDFQIGTELSGQRHDQVGEPVEATPLLPSRMDRWHGHHPWDRRTTGAGRRRSFGITARRPSRLVCRISIPTPRVGLSFRGLRSPNIAAGQHQRGLGGGPESVLHLRGHAGQAGSVNVRSHGDLPPPSRRKSSRTRHG